MGLKIVVIGGGSSYTPRKRWSEILEKGDPFYNPNFSLEKEPFNL